MKEPISTEKVTSNNKSSASYCQNGTSHDLEFTAEQLEAVDRVRLCKDYYEILGVNKDVTEAELKKQYRKLALQFHPDKNKAPGASEAFKMISNAFIVLNDPTKRKNYDLFGSEDQRSQMRDHSFTSDRYYQFSEFDGNISAEELFNIIFGVGNIRLRQNNRFREQRNSESQHGALIHFLPIFFFVSLSLIGSFFVSDPVYSLTKVGKYQFERRTNDLDIPYFVKDNFLNDYGSNLDNIESQVNSDFLWNLRNNCYREKNYHENLIWRARTMKDSALLEKVMAQELPSCKSLKDLEEKILYN